MFPDNPGLVGLCQDNTAWSLKLEAPRGSLKECQLRMDEKKVNRQGLTGHLNCTRNLYDNFHIG